MKDLFFILKSLLLTSIVVLLLQIKIGRHTFEERITVWLHNASVILPLNEVASGGMKAIKDLWKDSNQFIGEDFPRDSSSKRPEEELRE